MKRFFKTLITTLLITALAASLAGCGEIKKAEATVNNMFAAFKTLNFEEASKYIELDDMKIDALDSEDDTLQNYEMFMKSLFDRLDYKIIQSQKVDSNTVTVLTEIIAVDMKPVLSQFLAEALQYSFSYAFSDSQPSEEEINKKMEELFTESASKPDLSTVTNQVAIKVVKSDKGWQVVSDDNLIDALFGGIINASKEIAEAFEE